jgi:hypothetical protein
MIKSQDHNGLSELNSASLHTDLVRIKYLKKIDLCYTWHNSISGLEVMDLLKEFDCIALGYPIGLNWISKSFGTQKRTRGKSSDKNCRQESYKDTKEMRKEDF